MILTHFFNWPQIFYGFLIKFFLVRLLCGLEKRKFIDSGRFTLKRKFGKYVRGIRKVLNYVNLQNLSTVLYGNSFWSFFRSPRHPFGQFFVEFRSYFLTSAQFSRFQRIFEENFHFDFIAQSEISKIPTKTWIFTLIFQFKRFSDSLLPSEPTRKDHPHKYTF